MTSREHFRRLILIWLACTVVITPLVIFVFAPIVPPGQGTVQSSGQVLDNTMLFGLSTPIPPHTSSPSPSSGSRSRSWAWTTTPRTSAPTRPAR